MPGRRHSLFDRVTRRRSYGSLAVVENSADTDSVLTDPKVFDLPNICATCALCEILGGWSPRQEAAGFAGVLLGFCTLTSVFQVATGK